MWPKEEELSDIKTCYGACMNSLRWFWVVNKGEKIN